MYYMHLLTICLFCINCTLQMHHQTNKISFFENLHKHKFIVHSLSCLIAEWLKHAMAVLHLPEKVLYGFYAIMFYQYKVVFVYIV